VAYYLMLTDHAQDDIQTANWANLTASSNMPHPFSGVTRAFALMWTICFRSH
jgi:hypothetical protein